MHDKVKHLLDDAKLHMTKTVEHLERELVKIRAGKANTHMLDGIHVDYYGSIVPLSQIANINTTDARTIVIQPWEKNQIVVIEKAIMKANLGFNPENNGEIIRISVPPLTEERRKDLVKQAKQEGESAKIVIRNLRKDTNENIKKLKKDGVPEDDMKAGEEKLNVITHEHTEKVDKHVVLKEKDIMTV